MFFVFYGAILAQNPEQSVRNAMQLQEKAWNEGNIEQFMAWYWKSDSLMFIGSKGVTYGWEKTLANYKKGYPDKATMGQLSFELIQVKTLSTTAVYVVGKWALTREKPVGGHFTLLWRKIEGKWVIVSDHTSWPLPHFSSLEFTIFASHQMELKQTINPENVPQHVAIIMDGNGRWAKQQGEDRLFGHHEGVNSVREIVEACGEIGVRYLTLYAFSTENWNRPKEEVDGLMELLVNTISMETPNLHKKGVKLEVIGDLASLPGTCQQELEESMAVTKDNTRVTLVLALSYSSKWEITESVKQIAEKVLQGAIKINDINPRLIEEHLKTNRYPDPELMIRTSGEHRISNFLLWQLAYAEFYFTDVLWPDFRKEDFYKAILSYQNRERRFGKTSEQITQS